MTDKEGEIPTCVYSPVLRKLLQETSARHNPLFSLMTSKPIFPVSQEYIRNTRFQVSKVGMCYLPHKSDMLSQQGQKETCKMELSCYLVFKKLGRERFWNSEHNPDYVIYCTETDCCVRQHHSPLSTP